MTSYNYGPWAIHDGSSECPVGPDTLVQSFATSGTAETAMLRDPVRADSVTWEHVFAYRVATPRKKGRSDVHAYSARAADEVRFYNGHEGENRWQINLWLTYEIDENGLPIPETIRAERAEGEE